MTIRVGLIGFGVAGRYFHAPLLRAAGFHLVAAVTSRADDVHSIAPDAVVLDSAEKLLAREDIEMVVIATPTNLHVPQTRAALSAGKHVVVDKPISADSRDARELEELAKQKGLKLAVFHNRRWDNDFLTIKKLIDEDRLGRLNAFHARWDRYRPAVADRWREQEVEGNGVLYDLGAHLIDQALCLFGTPDWIQADVFTQRPRAVASDGFELLLAKDSARITLGVSTLAADGGPRYRVHGARGSYVKSGLDVQEAQLRAGMLANDASFGIEPQSQWGTFTDGASGERQVIPSEAGRWTHFYTQVRACIERGGPPPVSASEGREVIRIVEAALKSSESGRRVTF